MLLAQENLTLRHVIPSQGEWLLLFNYLLPFPEVLQQAAQLPPPSKGIRITANTETVSAMCYSTLWMLLQQSQPRAKLHASRCCSLVSNTGLVLTE